jgi:hypothetical protein
MEPAFLAPRIESPWVHEGELTCGDLDSKPLREYRGKPALAVPKPHQTAYSSYREQPTEKLVKRAAPERKTGGTCEHQHRRRGNSQGKPVATKLRRPSLPNSRNPCRLKLGVWHYRQPSAGALAGFTALARSDRNAKKPDGNPTAGPAASPATPATAPPRAAAPTPAPTHATPPSRTHPLMSAPKAPAPVPAETMARFPAASAPATTSPTPVPSETAPRTSPPASTGFSSAHSAPE